MLILRKDEETRQLALDVLAEAAKELPDYMQPGFVKFPDGMDKWTQEKRDAWFEDAARTQYFRTLHFHEQMINDILNKIQPIIDKAYRLGVSDGEELRNRLREQPR